MNAIFSGAGPAKSHIARLSQQAEKAYAQVQDIAVKALEGPASFKSFAAFQPMMPEQPRRPQPEK